MLILGGSRCRSPTHRHLRSDKLQLLGPNDDSDSDDATTGADRDRVKASMLQSRSNPNLSMGKCLCRGGVGD